ncbi:unnamed protein product [Heligmosomoides polygyrus]|uniref:Cir_N domain-containing protein n=1 Tax=Heligmosomoides polygyrus TaxID=6339 RepID=A0A183FT32_HELPZ|nr:unnamed protein product [Heligmosomoides polygyrus]
MKPTKSLVFHDANRGVGGGSLKEWETRDKEVRGLAKTAAEEKREMLRLQRIAAEKSTASSESTPEKAEPTETAGLSRARCHPGGGKATRTVWYRLVKCGEIDNRQETGFPSAGGLLVCIFWVWVGCRMEPMREQFWATWISQAWRGASGVTRLTSTGRQTGWQRSRPGTGPMTRAGGDEAGGYGF